MTVSTQANFFNLHLSGVGYINRIRWVNPSGRQGRRAEPFLACSIAALRGKADEPDYTYLDLKVSGEEAIQMVDRLGEDVEAQRKVFVSFRVGDIYPHIYDREVKDRQSGRKTGEWETASLIKGRLLAINSITIDGERVFTREDADTPEGEQPSAHHGPESHSPKDADESASAPEAQPAEAQPHRSAQPQRSNERSPAVARQQPARSANRSAAYQGGYAAGRATRQGVARAAQAMN